MKRTTQFILHDAKHKLQNITSAARLEAELLLAHALHVTRTQLLTRTAISQEDEQHFLRLLDRRTQGEPIAYILGYREFWSLPIKVTPAVLIPRPETELLVELTLAKLPKTSMQRIADLGTGSGAIALAIAYERPHWQVVATDSSASALEIANLNAKQLQINNIDFRLGDWCAALRGEKFNAIVSNPPYIAENDPHLTQGDLPFEPISALVAGHDGLRELTRIITQGSSHLEKEAWLLLEHGYNQSEAVQKLFQEKGYSQIVAHRDLAGIKRVVSGVLKARSS